MNDHISRQHSQIDQWKSIMFLYDSALKEINTKIEILNSEFVHIYGHTPIEHIKSRLKTPDSIVKKLKRDGEEVTIQNMVEKLNDIAGIRIICSYTQDIYQIADMIARQSDVTIVQVKDYIRNPKPNGYRSLHLILDVPIFLSSEKKYIKAEVQFRTIAMDFWASLEHKLKYKKHVDNTDEIVGQLRACADSIELLDYQMQEIRNKIDRSRA